MRSPEKENLKLLLSQRINTARIDLHQSGFGPKTENIQRATESWKDFEAEG